MPTRVEPGEIEAAILRHPGIAECAVVAVEAEGRGQLAAYIVAASPNKRVADHELGRFAASWLPQHMIPASITWLDALPRTSNGKLDRQALTQPAAAQISRNYIAPRDGVESALVAIWETVLETSPVGVTDNFFVLGGHSLLAIRLLSCLQKAFQIMLPLSAIFAAPTVEELGNVLRKQVDHAVPASLIRLRPGQSDSAALFLVHPLGGYVFCYAALGRHLPGTCAIYGLQSPGLYDHQTPLASIEAMASHYVSEMLMVQPQGPYLLGGWSMGGVIAFEIARQLVAQKHDIRLLALLDSSIPGEEAPGIDTADLLAGLFQEFGVAPDKLRTMTDAEQLAYVVEQGRKLQLLPDGIGAAEIKRLVTVAIANKQAVQRYRPGPYPGPIHLFIAEEWGAASQSNPIAEWGQFAHGGVTAHNVPGSHATMVAEPHVRVLAERLARLLDAPC